MRLAMLAHQLGVGEHAQALGHRHVAGDLDPAPALDLHDADAAVAGDRKRRVIAEIRDLVAVGERRLQHGLAALGLDRLAVYEDLGHSRLPSNRERLCSIQ